MSRAKIIQALLAIQDADASLPWREDVTEARQYNRRAMVALKDVLINSTSAQESTPE
jgi:hypothetical protein